MHYKKIVKKSWKLTGYGYGKSLAIFVVNKAFYNKKTWLYSIGLNTAKNNQDYPLWSGIDGLDVGNSRRVGKEKKVMMNNGCHDRIVNSQEKNETLS